MEERIYKLEEIIDTFVSGDWGEESSSSENPNPVKCVRGADIVPIWNSSYKDIPTRYISNRSYRTKRLKIGDIIIEKSGGSPTQSTGRTAFVTQELLDVNPDLVCTNFCTAFRIKEQWNPQYVYYYLQFLYNSNVFFNFEGKTSGLKNLQIDTAFTTLTIPYISKESQDKIVSVINKIDRKIALNREINRNLEAMAKQLYDYWFVQFDFPDENGRPYKSSGGKMVWNETLKREIPEGWEVLLINNVAEVFNGATPSTTNAQNYGGSIVWITPKDLSDQKQKFIYQGERNITQNGFDSCSTHLLPVNTILMSSRAPIGLLAIAKKELCTNQGFKSFVPKEARMSTYLYYYLQYHIKQIEQLGTGTTFKEVSREDVLKYPILKPNTGIIDKWEAKITTFNEKQLEIQKENEYLTKTRDELLPLLMNGQVEVMPLNSDLSEH